MKKFATIILATLFVFGFFGCKLNVPEPTYTLYLNQFDYSDWLEVGGKSFQDKHWIDFTVTEDYWNEHKEDLTMGTKLVWTKEDFSQWWTKRGYTESSAKEATDAFFSSEHHALYFREGENFFTFNK